jgi:hypothetical protein
MSASSRSPRWSSGPPPPFNSPKPLSSNGATDYPPQTSYPQSPVSSQIFAASSTESSSSNSDMKKPSGSNAEGGTYTCTYHGCTVRFETRAKLQKHKREAHRQSTRLDGGTPVSQAGPHKCTRISLQTGRPCNYSDVLTN